MQINSHATVTHCEQPTFKFEFFAFILPYMNGIMVALAMAVRLGLIQILNISMFTRWMSRGGVGKQNKNGWK